MTKFFGMRLAKPPQRHQVGMYVPSDTIRQHPGLDTQQSILVIVVSLTAIAMGCLEKVLTEHDS